MQRGSSSARMRISTRAYRGVYNRRAGCSSRTTARGEAMLADAAAERPREDAGLQRGHPHVAVELRAPRRLVLLDQEPQAVAELVARRGALAAAPLRQGVRQPLALVERGGREAILGLQLPVPHGELRLCPARCSRR